MQSLNPDCNWLGGAGHYEGDRASSQAKVNWLYIPSPSVQGSMWVTIGAIRDKQSSGKMKSPTPQSCMYMREQLATELNSWLHSRRMSISGRT